MRCVHGEVADYPLVPVSIKFRGKTAWEYGSPAWDGRVGVCGEGGVGRQNALMGERVLRRAVKRRASE